MNDSRFSRRRFIKSTTIGMLGPGMISATDLSLNNDHQDKQLPKIKEYRLLGRTGFRVSDIGSGEPYSENLLRATLEAGVNFFETSESYYNGRSESMIGNVIRDFSRDNIFIATKASPTYRIFKSADDIIQRAENSLKRLQTDYIDLYMIHQAQNIIKVRDRYFHKAAERLKKEGKIRFTGLSCHGPTYGPEARDSLEDILMAAIEDGRYDVIFLPYNFLNPDMGERIIKACTEMNIGTMIMKSNPVVVYDNYEKTLNRGRELSRDDRAIYDDLKSQMLKAEKFFSKNGIKDIEKMKEAAVQFILNNKGVSTICCRFPNYSDINRYVSLSGTTLDERASTLLAEYKDYMGFLNCRIGCNICEASCPENIPVNKILRYNYYFISHNQQKYAMDLYSNPAINKPDVCIDCEGYCEKACPYGVKTRMLLAIAHENLNFERSSYT